MNKILKIITICAITAISGLKNTNAGLGPLSDAANGLKYGAMDEIRLASTSFGYIMENFNSSFNTKEFKRIINNTKLPSDEKKLFEASSVSEKIRKSIFTVPLYEVGSIIIYSLESVAIPINIIAGAAGATTMVLYGVCGLFESIKENGLIIGPIVGSMKLAAFAIGGSLILAVTTIYSVTAVPASIAIRTVKALTIDPYKKIKKIFKKKKKSNNNQSN